MAGRLVALAVDAGPQFVDELKRAWANGDAVLPVDLRLPAPARARLLDAMAPAVLIDSSGEHQLDHANPVEPGDALVMATSGSTGDPKGVVLTHAAVEASAIATSKRLGIAPARHHWLACLPVAHVGGLSVITRALVTGTRLTVLPGFDADAVMTSDATHTSLVYTALARIEPARFECIVLGGSRPPAAVLPPNAVTTYGMTETGSGIVYDGVALDGVEMKIVTPDATGLGELHVRGPMLLRCYRDGGDPKASDGWFATGDLARIAFDGTLQVEGRRGDLIITGGENVWPDPVETILLTHPLVLDVAVAGRPDPQWGQRVVAYVVARDPEHHPTLTQLRDHVRLQLPAHCAPKQVVDISEVPRTALGKVRRSELRGE